MSTICWHELGSGQCRASHRGHEVLSYGRCRSGRRWFWHASSYDDPTGLHGWSDSEDQAVEDARNAVGQLANGRGSVAYLRHGQANDRLKQINAEKRRLRPPSEAKDVPVVEYLYSARGSCPDDGYSGYGYTFCRFRITKRTAKRVFYAVDYEWIDEHEEPTGHDRSRAGDIGFVDRRKLETDGHVRNRGRHWSSRDSELYASLEGLLATHRRDEPQDGRPSETIPLSGTVSALKAAMTAAHPDRGGTSAAFIEARQQYEAARRAADTAP